MPRGTLAFAIPSANLLKMTLPVRATELRVAITLARQASPSAKPVYIGVLRRVVMVLRAVGPGSLMARAVPAHVLAVAARGVVPKVEQSDVRPMAVVVTDLHPGRARADEGFRDQDVNRAHNVVVRPGKAHDRIAARVKRELEDTDAASSAGPGKAPHPPKVGDFIQPLVIDNGKPIFGWEHDLILHRLLRRCHWWTGDPVLGRDHLAGPCEMRVNPEFAAFKEEMAEMVMDTCGVPEAEREMWRDLR